MNPFLRFGGSALIVIVAGLSPASGAEPEKAIAVIVAASPARSLKLEELALIYRRKKLFSSEGTKLNPVNLQASNPLRRMFSRVVLGSSPEDLEKYWNDMYFHGVSPPFVLTSEEAVLRFVAQTPGAIGYVSYCSVDARVSVALVISDSGQVSANTAGIVCQK